MELELLDLRQLYSLTILNNYYKNQVIHGHLEHSHDTRYKIIITRKIICKKSIGQKNHTYLGLKLCDMLPMNIRNMGVYKIFKKHGKRCTPRNIIREIIENKFG